MESIKGSRTAVLAVSSSDDFAKVVSKDPDRMPRTAFMGTAPSMAANRISWFFDRVGPSVHVETACSSSAVALDTACQYIRSRDASMVSFTYLAMYVTGDQW